ncbi:HNH endonuclease family protein [Bifidobacterium dolichotidis]|uniref:HNH endonuclease family protein n=1 Tax=Bifidobacterium dolichotidis TaxID=2306976 RepID=UPI000F7F3596
MAANRRSSRRSSGTSRKPRTLARGKRSDASIQRVLILLILAIVVGIIIGFALPHVNDDAARLTGRYTATGTAAETLEKLPVQDGGAVEGYDRELFGYRTTDDDGNGCDVRDDVLARDMTNVVFTKRGSCKVKSGDLQDPYTGQLIHFKRGKTTSSAVQIDHVVALENAWRSGASEWDASKRLQFGNDMYNLLAVDGPANQDKGSKSAAYWLPTNGEYRCDYVARQIGVKDKYGLSVTTPEKRAMLSILHGCPGQSIPADQ